MCIRDSTQSVWKAAYTYITTKADEIENYNEVKVTHRTLMLELEWTLTHSTTKQIKQRALSATVYIQAWDDIPCSRKGGLMRMAPSSCPCALTLALWCWWTNSQKEQSGSWAGWVLHTTCRATFIVTKQCIGGRVFRCILPVYVFHLTNFFCSRYVC